MIRNAFILLAAIIALGSSSAYAQTVGDWVLGNYQKSGYWFAGIAESINGGKVTIRYDDGERETVSLRDVRPYDWMIGSRVECNFKMAGEWYPGTIASLAGEKVGINYDDGDKETTTTGLCRSR